MATSRRGLLKGSAGLLVLSGLPCGCNEEVVSSPNLELVDGFLEVPLELYPQLEEVGGWALVLFRGLVIIIARVESDTFVCLDALCTHERCAIRYNPAARQFPCPCHGALFAESGALLEGPAETPLQSFPIEFSADSVIVDLRESPIEL